MKFTIEELIDYELRTRTNKCKVVLIDEIHGDGLQLVFVCPLATRPSYYILRVDSNYDFADPDEEIEGERFVEIALNMITNQCDELELDAEYIFTGKNAGKYYRGEGKNKEIFSAEFPMLNISVGYNYDTLANARTGYINGDYIANYDVAKYLNSKTNRIKPAPSEQGGINGTS